MAYNLAVSRAVLPEGDSVIFSLRVTPANALPQNTLVPFTISGAGVNTLDFYPDPGFSKISGLSGNFLIQDDKAEIVLNLINDLRTEGGETLLLRLTGPGRTESIGITITDTSTTPVNTAEFSIIPDRQSLYEGEFVIFDVTGKYVPAGTSVPYTLSGIQNSDLYNIPVSGNLIFQANSTYDTTANIRLQLLEDSISEGDENIVMLLNPDFAYTLQINGTALVYDSSTTASKKLRVSSDKLMLVEGDNVTFTVNGDNIQAGTNVFYRIIPWTSWDTPDDFFPATDLTANDFVGLTSFYGQFPPLYEPEANAISNISSVTFTTVDDYIFEPTEYFYLGVYTNTGLSTGSGIVGIRDSGNTYLRSTNIFSGDAVVTFLEPAILSANTGGMFTKLGAWEDTSGELSNYMVVQGKTPFATEESGVYYQPFSYVIRSSRSIEDWMLSVKDVLHPAGFAVFSEINNETDPENLNYAGVSINNDSEIFTYSSINADSVKGAFNASNTEIFSVYTLPLTVDIVSLQTNPQ
jgi:hypothetical protein